MLSGKNLVLSIMSHSMVRMNGVASTADISQMWAVGVACSDRWIKQRDSQGISPSLMPHISSVYYEH